ncbi:hypothetical protein B0J13DRAFT_514426 [Dactylonectria estremocensis]|uniref:Zn(2)-C6 fungal-type domain-containing protein n=1 Tax=Dactylonectria estremocensis TaxID=1079267 RepID=A0A9P9DC23_9HYPO|nr:hypothetical protein B0J13DRAFT_514426 [Dactylonectria estremocensis]
MDVDTVKSDDVRQSDRSDRPLNATKRRRRATRSCTECRRRKRKCDGKLPCCDCRVRDKANGCHYADGTMPHNQETASPHGSMTTSVCNPTSTTDTISTGSDSNRTLSISELGYVRTGASTADFLDRIGRDEVIGELGTSCTVDDSGNLWERYKRLAKKLPTRACIENLADFYFREINWQYYALDEGAFNQQLQAWYQLDLQASNADVFEDLSTDWKAFPALLFELVGTALLLMTPEAALAFNDFNYVDSMSSETMAMEYSESGMAILRLLGKRQVSLTTVFAGFLRVAFLKYFGQVTEAWHALGEAVKDAQEIGLHLTKRDPKPRTNHTVAVLENQWNIQDRRRIWMILSGWDIHTAMVLGRPPAIVDTLEPTLPIDAFITANRLAAPALPRGAHDAPTPLTRAIWAYRIMNNLRKVQALEKEGSYSNDFSHVDCLDQDMRQLDAQIPPFFCRRNPDRRFDLMSECYWISRARATLPQLLSFNLMALHRPYIFTRAASRSRVLEACLDMLQAQREHFESINENQYKTFFLFFGTFDAIVLIASIYTFFPKDHPKMVAEAVQHFQWSTERFEAISDRNGLAKAAVVTLHTLFERLKRTFDRAACQLSVDAPTVLLNTPVSPIQARTMPAEPNGSVPCPSAISRSPSTRPSPSMLITSPKFQVCGPPAASFDWSLIEPIYAMGDMAYKDLIGSLDGSTAKISHHLCPTSDPGLPLFSGDFGDNSVWSVLNQGFEHGLQ